MHFEKKTDCQGGREGGRDDEHIVSFVSLKEYQFDSPPPFRAISVMVTPRARLCGLPPSAPDYPACRSGAVDTSGGVRPGGRVSRVRPLDGSGVDVIEPA